jgi:hypothetical protein
MMLLHTHGRIVGWARGRPGRIGRVHLSLRLAERAERKAGCPGGAACCQRHTIEHMAWRYRAGIPPEMEHIP